MNLWSRRRFAYYLQSFKPSNEFSFVKKNVTLAEDSKKWTHVYERL